MPQMTVKLVSVIVKFFNSENKVKNDILDSSNLSREMAVIIHNKIVSVLKKFKLDERIISFSGENVITHFGGIAKKGQNNIFLKLKIYLSVIFWNKVAVHT
jgi:hypothetical protein